MLSDTITTDELETLTDAFYEKAKMAWGETEEERLRCIIQMVIVDTMLTVEGVTTVEEWKPDPPEDLSAAPAEGHGGVSPVALEVGEKHRRTWGRSREDRQSWKP